MGLNPFEHFPVAFAGRQFLQQSIGIEAKKLHQALVGCAMVVILAVFLCESRQALVEHAGQNQIVAQTNAKAPRWALSQINKVMSCFHSPPVSTTMKTLDKVKLNARQRSADLLHCTACSKRAEINGD